jgi:chromosome segregation ATPase
MKPILLALGVFATLTCFAAPPAAATKIDPNDFALEPQDEVQKPILSATGKKRLQENVRTLDNNLHDLRENLVATDKNIATIRTELKDITGLENEHLDLKKKYLAYLDRADSEIKKNEKAKRDLSKWEQTSKTAAGKLPENVVKDKLEAARAEQADRDRWKYDAEAKTARVKTLLGGLETNLRDIRSRRVPLEQQLELWTARRAQYQKTIAETETKKAQWQSALTR